MRTFRAGLAAMAFGALFAAGCSQGGSAALAPVLATPHSALAIGLVVVKVLRPGAGIHADPRTLDTHACRLRGRLRGQGDRLLVTVWGVGYRLVDGPPEDA